MMNRTTAAVLAGAALVCAGCVSAQTRTGAMTGMILSPRDGTVYVTGLGNALIRLPR